MSDLEKNCNSEIIENDEPSNFNLVSKQIENLVGNITSFEKITRGSNEIFYAKTEKGEFIVKIYNEDRSQRTNLSREIQMSRLLKNLPEIRGMVFSDVTRKTIPYEFAIFDYVEGQTLRSLVESGSLNEKQLEDIADQIFTLIKKITKIPTENFGQLDESGTKGTSETWVGFLEDMQEPTTETFRDSSILPASIYLAPQSILDKHKDKFVLKSPKLIPMDLNIDNIIITPDQRIKFIDPETFWSGDSLCAYSQFYALTKGTPLGDRFASKLPLSSDDEFKMRFYALLDNLNVLAYITRISPEVVKEAKPWGNPNKFIDLIKEHIDYLKRGL